jgi:hypothetical protein
MAVDLFENVLRRAPRSPVEAAATMAKLRKNTDRPVPRVLPDSAPDPLGKPYTINDFEEQPGRRDPPDKWGCRALPNH